MKKYCFALAMIYGAIIFPLSSQAQLKVGRTKEQINQDNYKATAHFIGSNSPLGALAGEYKLYRLGDTTEILSYTTNTKSTGQLKFGSITEEKDVYEYVLALFDKFQDNEFFVGKTRVVPLKMGNVLGTKNLAFNINPNGASYKEETLVISKTGWVRLFKKSIIQDK